MMDWVASSSRLDLEVKRLEKKYAPSVNDENYREFHAYISGREQTIKKKHKQIRQFQGSLNNISSTLRGMENDKFDYNYFQNLLESFESKLSLFKASMAKEYEGLVEDEQTLAGDLSTLEIHIDNAMMKPKGSLAAKGGSIISHKQQEGIKKRNDKISAHKTEIGTIERKLASLGDRFGGWDPRDHDIFVRVWTQVVGPTVAGAPSDSKHASCVTKEESEDGRARSVLDLGSKTAHHLRRKLVQAVQMMTEEDIEDHISWFIEVESLQARKKDILMEWKVEREKDKPEDFASSATLSPAKNISSRIMSEKRREATKQKVEKWQREKEEERQRKERQERRQQEEEKRTKRREFAGRRQSNRVLVQNWVEERKAKEQAAAKKPEANKLSAAEREVLRKKQETEIEKAKTRRTKLNQARAASTGRLQRQKELAHAAADQKVKEQKSKVHEPTKAYLSNRLTAEDLELRERRRSGGGAHDKRIANTGYDLKFTGRAIPAWTRGVM